VRAYIHTYIYINTYSNIQTYIVEKIRRKITGMKEREWKITLCRVKAHAGIRGNEAADTLAKRAATN